ncbi:hypothetical protein [Roseibium sp. TrichSKD4]|uniref:hypothetical protein n=1 Tax=Roseibium sp. TrichSKD4 TaxID=744980 RepID=UPI00058C53A0|nr:hypothetical protein [Roseibium sp. TrichSKD4]
MSRDASSQIFSKYCGLMEDEGYCVELVISRGTKDEDWTLEVINTAGKSFLWDETFPSEDAAFSAFSETVQKKGMCHFHTFDLPTFHVFENHTIH